MSIDNHVGDGHGEEDDRSDEEAEGEAFAGAEGKAVKGTTGPMFRMLKAQARKSESWSNDR